MECNHDFIVLSDQVLSREDRIHVIQGFYNTFKKSIHVCILKCSKCGEIRKEVTEP